MLNFLHNCELLDHLGFLFEDIEASFISAIFHSVLAILRMLGQKEARVSIFELSRASQAIIRVLSSPWVIPSMLVDILHSNHVTVRQLSLFYISI